MNPPNSTHSCHGPAVPAAHRALPANRIGSRCLLLAVWCCLPIGAQSSPEPVVATMFEAQAVHIHDGDSLRVRDRHGRMHRLRLAYIDAPELNQAHGRASRDALRARLAQQRLRVRVVDTDRYGRRVAQVSAAGEDIALWQLQTGGAWHYRRIAHKHQQTAAYARYRLAEAEARQQRRGLWQDSRPRPPWTFRHTQPPSASQ